MYFVAEKPLKPVQWIVFGLMAAAVVAVGAFQFVRLQAAGRAGTVQCLVGPIQVRLRGRAGWFLHVAGESFRLPIRPHHLPYQAPYRVYVAPAAKRIVAMEPDGWA
jgi:hypothetical protein